MASFEAVGMYPILSEKNGVPTANLSSSCVMMSCPEALPCLRSNLTMLMSSFGSTSATSG